MDKSASHIIGDQKYLPVVTFFASQCLSRIFTSRIANYISGGRYGPRSKDTTGYIIVIIKIRTWRPEGWAKWTEESHPQCQYMYCFARKDSFLDWPSQEDLQRLCILQPSGISDGDVAKNCSERSSFFTNRPTFHRKQQFWKCENSASVLVGSLSDKSSTSLLNRSLSIFGRLMNMSTLWH